MNRITTISALLLATATLTACGVQDSQEARDREQVQRQQSQYAIAQPIPTFDWSLERELLIQLYTIRNDRVATHSVWRSDRGMIEGDCPSMGYGLPYDTSLTNPWLATDEEENGYDTEGLVAIGQPEPNGIFASTNTAATWVMCVGPAGLLEPVYVETKVTVYPGPVNVDYATSRVTRTGAPSVTVRIPETPTMPTTADPEE